MKKRILSLFLAFAMLVVSVPVSATTGAPSYRENIHKVARFDLNYTQFPVVADPTNILAANVFNTDISVSRDVIPEDLVVEIADCYVNDAEGIYWYQITEVEGYPLPAEIPANSWVFQNYAGSTGGESLIIQDLDVPAFLAVQAFEDYMASMPTHEMLAAFKAEEELGRAWGKIPLDSSVKPEKEQAAFDAANAALITAMNSTADNIGADIQDTLMGMAEAFYSADDLLPQGMDDYLSTADSALLETYHTLVTNLEMDIATFAAPKNPGVVGVATPNITVRLFNYNSNVNNGFYKFNMQGSDSVFEEDAGSPGDVNQNHPVLGNLDENGYPSVTDFLNDNEVSVGGETGSLGYLFGAGGTGVTECPITDLRLFTKNGTHYTYDSRYNAAVYDNGNFYAYNYALRPCSVDDFFSGMGQFLPFNGNVLTGDDSIDGAYFWSQKLDRAYQLTDLDGNIIQSAWDNDRDQFNGTAVSSDKINAAAGIAGAGLVPLVPNLYALYGHENNRHDLAFGMSVEFKFYMTEDGYMVLEDGTRMPIEFNFYGDDDVMVYIDDVPVLNLGGPRGITRGTIDFANNKTVVYEEYCNGEGDHTENHAGLTPADGNHTAESYRQVDDMNALLGGNLYGETHTFKLFYLERWGGASNCILDFNIPVIPDGEPQVKKVETGLNDSLRGKEEYTFVLRDANGNPVANEPYSLLKNGVWSEGVTDANGQFKLRHDWMVTFTDTQVGEQYRIEELTDSAKYDTDVTVDGVQQTENHITDTINITRTSQTAEFTNTWKTGSIVVEKQVAGVNLLPAGTKFNFQLILKDENGNPVNYSADGVTGNAFSLANGESITISGIPVGYTYEVTETLPTAPENAVYGAPQFSPAATGTVVDGENKVVVTNTLTPATGNLTINKVVTKENASDPWTGDTFTFTVSGSGLLPGAYTVTVGSAQQSITVGTSGTLTMNTNMEVSAANSQNSITISGLPVGSYTVTEQNKEGYIPTPADRVLGATISKGTTATVDFANKLNRYTGGLEITKHVSSEGNATATVTEFEFDIQVPNGVSGTYTYTVNGTGHSAEVDSSGVLHISLKNGEKAVFAALPIGEYTVTEHDYTGKGYSAKYSDSTGNAADGVVTVTKGGTATVICNNAFPVGSLTITKTVSKKYSGDEWTGDTFSFTVTRTDSQLEAGKKFPVYSGTTVLPDAEVNEMGALIITIHFDQIGTKTIKIDDLPQGQYQVVEAEANDYTQSERTQSTSITPQNYAGTAAFTNEYKKHVGNLVIKKTVVGADAPDTAFTFTVSGAAVTAGKTYTITIDGTDTQKTASADGKLTLELKDGETAEIKDLKLSAYQVAETVANDFVLTASTGATGMIAANVTAEATFTNTYAPRGSLKVTKFVEKEFEADVVPENKEFNFTVTIPADIDTKRTSYSYTKYHVGSKIEDATDDVPGESGTLAVASNTLTFTLKDGQYIIVEDLPVGAVTVTEAKIDGFDDPRFGTTIDAVQSGGTESFTGTVTKDALTAAFCVNTYQRTTGTLKVTKIVKNLGTGTVPVQEFEFTVELIPPIAPFTATVKYTDKDGNQVKADETKTVSDGKFDLTLKDGWTATIENLPASQVTVTETAYDDFHADWGANGNVGFVRSGQNLELTCTNTYAATKGNLMISKTVTKAYDRDVIPANEEYTVQVVFREESSPIEGSFAYKVFNKNDDPKTTTPVTTGTISSGGTLKLKADQFAMIYDIPVCNFDVVETAATSGLEHYDISYVHREGHRIVAGETVASEITNTYTRHLGTLTINKVVTGTDAKDTFIFHIKGKDEANKHIDMDVAITGSGSVTIYDLPLGSYTVTEDTSWSWRYNLSSSDTTDNTITLDDLHAVVIFTNTHENDKWLNYTANMPNVFGKKEDE